jgi:hypothetical protein
LRANDISTSSTESRAARRRSRPAQPVGRQSLLERYRSVVLIAIGIIGVGILGIVFYGSANAEPWTCQSLLTPGPSSADPSADLGFATRDLGRRHLRSGASTTYEFCPPTSGEHFEPGPQAPLPRAFYGPTAGMRPGNWVHNLEHGYAVILYRKNPGQETLDSMKATMDAANGDAASTACGQQNRVIAAEFDDIDTPFAVLAWDRILLLPEWDAAAALAFANQWQGNPAAPESGAC